jgi:rare lipoprotein A
MSYPRSPPLLTATTGDPADTAFLRESNAVRNFSMMQNSNQSMSPVRAVVTIAAAWALGGAASVASTMVTADNVDATPTSHTATVFTPTAKIQIDPNAKLQLDRSGQPRTGVASFYANQYSGKKMADGTPMRLFSNNAASITLPLGTTARVTNLATGRSAMVTIRDRGPYVRGRIVDLSPATARQIGLERKKGLAKVEVAPVTVPLADGTVKIMPNAVVASG